MQKKLSHWPFHFHLFIFITSEAEYILVCLLAIIWYLSIS